MKRFLFTLFLGCLSCLACRPREIREERPPVPSPTPFVAELQGEYLLVDTKKKQILFVADGAVKETFDQVAFGSSGIGLKHRRGDSITPTGQFKIAWKNPASRFRLFFGLDYPSVEYAERAVNEKVISKKQLEQIRAAHELGKVPPQDTPLGGHIGIHGIGRGDIQVHRSVNWTDGCVAVDNDQIDKLGKLVKIGMPVIIR